MLDLHQPGNNVLAENLVCDIAEIDTEVFFGFALENDDIRGDTYDQLV